MLLSFSNKVFELEFEYFSLSVFYFFIFLKKVFCREQTRKVHAKLVDVLVYSSAIKTCATETVKNGETYSRKKEKKKKKEEEKKAIMDTRETVHADVSTFRFFLDIL